MGFLKHAWDPVLCKIGAKPYLINFRNNSEIHGGSDYYSFFKIGKMRLSKEETET